MRTTQDPQFKLGEVAIDKIKFDDRSRDDTVKVLKGLQYIYCNVELRNKIFALLESEIANNNHKNKGGLGMSLWNIFVLGIVKLACDVNYDRLLDTANNHRSLRRMLGHGEFDDDVVYKYTTLVDNVGLLSEGLLLKINDLVVEAGHGMLKQKRLRAKRASR